MIQSTTAVLLSGGLDSAVLLADEATRGEVQPIYVSVGLAWEPAEREVLNELLATNAFRQRVRSLVSLSLDMRDVYPRTHWAVAGRPPAYHTPDEDVYLPGRNIVLLGKASTYCAAGDIGRLVLGSLGHNPFPDATPAFRDAMANALSLGLGQPLRIDAPYAEMSKAGVIKRGVALSVPLELTLSCMNPVRSVRKVREVRGVREVHLTLERLEPVELEPLEPIEPFEPLEPVIVHCGVCSKCRERHDAFLEAGVADPTSYSDTTFVEAGFSGRE
jgi:7-cyano-7-deazaguanine synthase